MLNIFTIVLNGQPYIERHLPIFQKLKSDWHWFIAHGTANNGSSTGWCQPQKPGLSTDGTKEYLRSVTKHPNVTIIENKLWPSKDDQCNAALERMKQPGILIQIDADEIWTVRQLNRIAEIFHNSSAVGSMMFACRYFIGPDLITVGENCYGDYDYEWLRAWRFRRGMKFATHEPPVLIGETGRRLTKAETRAENLVFDHFAYATEPQVAFKEKFYGYAGAVEQWKKLQTHRNFPTELQRFFPWVDSRVKVDRVSVLQ